MIDVTTTFAYLEILLSITILTSLVIIVKRKVEMRAKLLTGG